MGLWWSPVRDFIKSFTLDKTSTGSIMNIIRSQNGESPRRRVTEGAVTQHLCIKTHV